MKTLCGAIFSILIAAFAVFGQNSRPTMPFVDKGACPFECCTYREWTVDKATAVRSAMRDGSSIAFRLKKGERVRGLTGSVITSQPGEVRVLKRTKIGRFTAQPGDTLYLLTYVGEGFHRVWYKGRITEEETYDRKIFASFASQNPSGGYGFAIRAVRPAGAASRIISGIRISAGIEVRVPL